MPTTLAGVQAQGFQAEAHLWEPPTHLQPFLLDFIHLLFLHQRQEFPRLVDGAQEVLRQTLPLVAAVFVCKRTETGTFADSLP